jgi:hypothetical protein
MILLRGELPQKIIPCTMIECTYDARKKENAAAIVALNDYM